MMCSRPRLSRCARSAVVTLCRSAARPAERRRSRSEGSAPCDSSHHRNSRRVTGPAAPAALTARRSASAAVGRRTSPFRARGDKLQYAAVRPAAVGMSIRCTVPVRPRAFAGCRAIGDAVAEARRSSTRRKREKRSGQDPRCRSRSPISRVASGRALTAKCSRSTSRTTSSISARRTAGVTTSGLSPIR